MGGKPRRELISFQEKLEILNACQAAINWVDEMSFKEAWEQCDRGDWMLWLILDVAFRHDLIVDEKLRELSKALRSTHILGLWDLCKWAGMSDVNQEFLTITQARKLAKAADWIRQIWPYRTISRRVNERVRVLRRKGS